MSEPSYVGDFGQKPAFHLTGLESPVFHNEKLVVETEVETIPPDVGLTHGFTAFEITKRVHSGHPRGF